MDKAVIFFFNLVFHIIVDIIFLIYIVVKDLMAPLNNKFNK